MAENPEGLAEPSPEEIAAVRDESIYDADEPRPPFERKLRREQSHAPEAHRMLPASSEAEQAVLCSIMLDPKTVGLKCHQRGIQPETFHVPAHGEVYGVLRQMWDKGEPIDPVTLTQKLFDLKKLEQCGGGAFVSHLFTFLPTAINADYYLDILQEKHTLRQIIQVCTEHASRAYSEQDNVTGLLDEAESSILAIRQKRSVQRGFTGRDVASEGFNALVQKWERQGAISGLSTGFIELDRKTDGLHDTELVVLAARPSLGKSALAMNIAEYVAIEAPAPLPVGVLSLEMGKKRLSERLMASRARVNTAKWRAGYRPTALDEQRMHQAHDDFYNAPLYFEELSDPKIQEVRGIGRRWKADFGIRLIIIDSLSVLRSDSKQARENRAREVAECVNGCKEMAKELELPIILIAHLGRGADKTDKHGNPIAVRPVLSDLRESGNIEQDADSVWMLWQPAEGETELFIPKNRDGERYVTVPLCFQKEFVRYDRNASVSQEELPM